jgi:hypothetical protein
MALSQQDLDTITSAIDKKLEEKMNGRCACNLVEDDRKEMGHFVGRLRDLGDGNLNVGIEVFSRVVRMINKRRRMGEKIGGNIAVLLCVSAAGGMLTLIVLGFITWIKKVLGE